MLTSGRLQEIHCQFSHCVQVNGESSAQCGGERETGIVSSHRKIHHVHQELTPHYKPRLQNLLLTNFCRPTTSHGCSSGGNKMLENGLHQQLILFMGLCRHLQVTSVALFPCGSPNSTAAFHGFPFISCFHWLEIEVLIFSPCLKGRIVWIQMGQEWEH